MSGIRQASAFGSWGPLASARVEEIKGELGESPEKDRILKSQVLAPIEKCVAKGYSDEFIGSAGVEELCYAADFGGRPDDFKDFMKKNKILSMSDHNLAHELVKEALSREDYMLRDIPDYKKYGRAPDGIDQVDFVRRVSCMPPEDWYVAAIDKIGPEDFKDLCSVIGNPLVRVALRSIWGMLRNAPVNYGLQWIAIYKGNKIIVLPIYEWQLIREVLSLTPLFVFETEYVLYVCDRYPQTLLNMPQLRSFGTGESPVTAFVQSKLKLLKCQINCNLLEMYQCIVPAVMNIVYGYDDWLLYLVFYDRFKQISTRWGVSLASAIVLQQGTDIAISGDYEIGKAVVDGVAVNVYESWLLEWPLVGSVTVGNKKIDRSRLRDYVGIVSRCLREKGIGSDGIAETSEKPM